MGRIYISYLDQDISQNAIDAALGNQATEQKGEEQKAGALLYVCKNCKIHFADATNLISKAFRGKTGTAFLFGSVINVFMGPESEKTMMTGVHIVSDVYCVQCSTVIGWTYVKAFEED